jgi:putative ABC transport system substrate-binding protein
VWRRSFLPLLSGATASVFVAAHAQRPRLPTIGLLSTRSHIDSAYLVSSFENGVYSAGFDQTVRVIIESRWADGRYDRLPALATELVSRHVDVLVAVGGEPSVMAAKKAAGTDTPLVFAMPFLFVVGNDPVELGLVQSLGRPGGSATGLVIRTLAIGAKRLDLLRQVVPPTTAFGALVNPNFPQAAFQRRELAEAGRSLNRDIHFVNATTENEVEPAFDELVKQGAGALVVTADPFFDMVRRQIVALAAERHLPAIYQHREYTLDGGLMSYGINLTNVYRMLGSYAGQVLRGIAPSNLPVQQMDDVEFVLNLKTARLLGLQVPSTLTAFANALIE